MIKTKNDTTESKNILSSSRCTSKNLLQHHYVQDVTKKKKQRFICSLHVKKTFHSAQHSKTNANQHIKQISKNKFTFSDLWKNASSSPTPPEDQLIFWRMAGYIPNGIHNITQEKTTSKKKSQKNKLFSLIITEVNTMTRNILKEKKMSDKLQLTELMNEILLEDQTQDQQASLFSPPIDQHSQHREEEPQTSFKLQVSSTETSSTCVDTSSMFVHSSLCVSAEESCTCSSRIWVDISTTERKSAQPRTR